jgi:hypothetical protein
MLTTTILATSLALATCLVLAGVASAADPEFVHLAAKGTFKALSDGPIFIRSASATVICEHESSTGVGKTMDTFGNMVVKYTGCKVDSGTGSGCTFKSRNPLGGAGEIITNTLKGELGLVATSEAASGVGILTKAENGAIFTTFETAVPCTTDVEAAEGDVAGEASPIKTLSTKGIVIFAPTSTAALHSEKISKIRILAGTEEPALESFGSLLSSLQGLPVGTSEEAVEID